MKTRKTSTALLAAALLFQCTTLLATGKDDDKSALVKLNSTALAYAKELINEGHVVRDEKGAWSKDKPLVEQENEFIRAHGFSEYAKWHLGIDPRYPKNTKRRYKFPYGDFKNVHRCGVLAVQSRAREYGYFEIASAATQLRDMIEATHSGGR